jgi:hypothetical protein
MKSNNQKGFIGIILVLIFALALAKYFFNWNIIDFLNSPEVIAVFSYIKKFIILVWEKFLAGPVLYVWNTVIVGIFWKYAVIIFDAMKGWVDGQS